MTVFSRAVFGMAFWFSLPGLSALAADGQAGPYLAAREAGLTSDYTAAAEWYARASAADPANAQLLQNTLLTDIAVGDIANAIPLARKLDAVAPKNAAVAMVILSDAAKQEQYQTILTEMDKGRSVGPLVDGLVRGWAQLGLGQMSEASASFDKMIAVGALKPFGLYHKALALASVGDFEGALKNIQDPATEGLRKTRRVALIEAQILSQLERDPEALDLIGKIFGPDPDPGVAAIRERLKAGDTLPFTGIATARDGIAETFWSIALVLNGQTGDDETLAYARLAHYLRPDHVDAILMGAGLLEKQGQYDLAGESYKMIGRDDPAFYMAELGRAEALAAAERTDAAVEVLGQLAKATPNLPDAWLRLGDLLRRNERFDEAVRDYDQAIAALGEAKPGHWGVYYARGICYERLKDWPKAEADFRKALELSPDQADVLNYMGYSFLERKENLPEALSMIKRAAAAQPDSGAISDSLGWGLFQTGRYEEAVEPMEHAIELMPVDSLVNDHLGDVYWAVGRKREAEFQWSRALSFKPDTEEAAARIRRKLEVGLDALLQEEGATPLTQSANGN